MVELKKLFSIVYGVNLDYDKMVESKNGIPFVSRTSQNNGVVGYVEKVKKKNPNPAMTLSLSVGGSVMECFLQEREYYSGRDLYYLKPKVGMSRRQLFYYCIVLRANKYRYSFGRQANKTLKDLLVPDLTEIPSFVATAPIPIKPSTKALSSGKRVSLKDKKWQWFLYKDVFQLIKISKSFDLNALELAPHGIPYIGRTIYNNGLTNYVKDDFSPKDINKANCLTVVMVGESVTSTFYQKNDFVASQNMLIIRDDRLNKYSGQFVATCINLEKYRFSYGRTLTLSYIKNHKIKLPVTESGKPDWQFMEDYIKSLPYSAELATST